MLGSSLEHQRSRSVLSISSFTLDILLTHWNESRSSLLHFLAEQVLSYFGIIAFDFLSLFAFHVLDCVLVNLTSFNPIVALSDLCTWSSLNCY